MVCGLKLVLSLPWYRPPEDSSSTVASLIALLPAGHRVPLRMWGLPVEGGAAGLRGVAVVRRQENRLLIGLHLQQQSGVQGQSGQLVLIGGLWPFIWGRSLGRPGDG